MNTTRHTVLITGGATGIGLALAHKFRAQDNRVILMGRTRETLEAAAQETEAEIFQGDICSEADRCLLIETHPDISVLVNNAGIQINQPIAASSADDIRRELDINFLAPVLLTHALLPTLHKQPAAAIVNVSSGLALVPKEVAAIYCASKAAMHSFSQTLRWQLENSPIKVFDLLPPLVDTAMTAGRGKGKISPDALADEFWRAFENDRYTIYAGKTKLLHIIHRILPKVAEKIMRKGL